jgi:PAS domain S-box-containing protein
MPPSQERFGGRFRSSTQSALGLSAIRSPYPVALAAFGVAALVRYLLSDSLGANVPYLQFFPAVMVAAWYGGLGPGLLCTAASALASMYFLLPPAGLAVGDPTDVLSLGLFVAIGVVISWLNERLQLSQQAQRTEAGAALTRAERLDAILNLAVDGIIVIDATGRIEAFNRGAQEIFGYHEEEVLGRNVSMLMPSPHHEQHDAYLERYLATGEAKIIGSGREVTGRRRDGTVVPVQLSVREMRIGGEGTFTGMLHDLTKRADLEGALGASEARWRAIFDSAVDGIIVIDAHGRIEAFNHAAERLFGYTADEVLGRNVDLLMPSPYHEQHDTYLSRYLATARAKIIGIGREVEGRRQDGTTFPLHLSVGEIAVQGERKFAGILHDLTSRVQMEGRLREQEALAKLGEMAAVIAHEIKNPLAGIRGAIQVFGNKMVPDVANTPILNEIVWRIDSLDQMMKDLLLFARPPTPKPAPVDLVPLVRTTANLLSTDPALRDVEIDVEGAAPPVSADPDMMRVVFQNLLINSAHAMRGKGRIRVAVEMADTTCQIVFADGGPGIPPDVRDKIFTPFFTTKARGTGLGLPTVKRLIEAHHGQIAIDCPPAGGTTVLIRLPTGMP